MDVTTKKNLFRCSKNIKTIEVLKTRATFEELVRYVIGSSLTKNMVSRVLMNIGELMQNFVTIVMQNSIISINMSL